MISDVFKRLGYWGPFLILVGAGAGLPVPEEVTMTGSGYLLYRGQVELFPIIATCWVATLIGDSIPFWLGRLLGPKALKIPFFAKALHPERFALIEEKVRTHGGWAIFTTRFLPGLRLPCFFTAGTARMSYARFMLHDATAAALMVPMYVLLGRAFGTKIGVLEATVQNSTETLGFVLLLGLAFAGARMMSRRRDRQAAALDAPEPDKTDDSGEIQTDSTSSSPIEPPKDPGATG
ncbi:MAG: membrane protein DedA with SNARE-associated domain [Planctomycetota bacterium]|jgi:membrane protein DedA with SNARE-associated domain